MSVEFFEVVVVGLFHFLAFGEILLFEDGDVAPELFHRSLYA